MSTEAAAPGVEARGDTRSRILEVALELFAAHGYEKTSLRRISDSLGVTKAALYYHFRTKEDILAGIVESLSAPLETVIAWADALPQPLTAELREELLRRLSSGMSSEGITRLMRFMRENQPTVRALDVAQPFKERMAVLARLLQGPSPSFEDQVRAMLCLIALSAGDILALNLQEREEPLPERRVRDGVSLGVALDVAARIGVID
jgi:AcrR family transcriptional regulator